MIEQGFYSLLSTTPAVTAIAGDRVYFNVRPQNERRPSVVLTRVSTGFFRTFKSRAEKVRGAMQVDCLAPTYRTAKELARAVRGVLDGFKGNAGDTRFRWVQIDDESDIPTVPLEGKAEPTFGVSLDVRFMADEQQ
jgi:hypothetical protein